MARAALAANAYRPEAISRAYTVATVTWGGNGNHDLAVYYPGVSGRPVVAILHGGWVQTSTWLTSAALVALARTLAENGFVAVLADFYGVPVASGNASTAYRQGMITDVLSLMTWLRTNIATYNGDVTKIAILGESGGGQLALMAGIQGTASTTRPDAIIGWSPATRLDRTAYASGQAHAGAGVFINNYLGVADQSTGAGATTAQSFSPYNQVSSNLPPILIVGSSTEPDLGIQQSDFDDMHTAALGAGVDSTKVILSGAAHADLRGLYDAGSMAWLAAKMPWTKANGRSAAGSRSSAGTRVAA